MLVPTDTLNSPLLRTISKALDADPVAGLELVRLSLFEALADLAEQYGPAIRADISKAAGDSRSQLVRQYVSKRIAGEDTAAVLEGAQVIARISKDEDAETRRRASAQEPRDHGKFASANAKGKVDIIGAHTSAMLNALSPDGKPLDEKSGYQKLAATGRALTYVSALSANQAGLAAGAMAQLVGEIGPQAENVLGPSVKRTAYRYRGTEKKPSPEIQTSAHQLGTIAQKIGDGTALTQAEQVQVGKWLADVKATPRRTDGDRPVAQDPAASVFASVMADRSGKSGDDLRLEATSQYLASTLQNRIPSLHHAKISLAGGKMPPSIGYLVDSDGDVVSEAQGYNGDHYLPFDLKNLSDLHGGSYVRTRTTGGPTDEDIYTGLMMGARQVTVVSHSGVFTVAFDKDVRGGRRYSDKARQMVDRYSSLLEQINSGQHMEVPFSQGEMNEMRQRAVSNAPRNADQQKQLLNQYMSEKRDELTFADDDELQARAVQNVAADYAQGDMTNVSRQTAARDTEDEYHDLRKQRDAAQARSYRLDGVGYEAALTALQQEFPFYLQTPQYETWRDFTKTRQLPAGERRGVVGQKGGARSADIGYTAKNGLVPTRIAGQSKTKPAAAEQVEAPKAGDVAPEQAQQAAPSTTGPSEADIRASGLEANVANTTSEAVLAVRQFGDEGSQPVQNATDEMALSDDANGAYLRHIANKYQNPRAIAQFLMAPSTDAAHIGRMQRDLKWLQTTAKRYGAEDDYPPEFWDAAQTQLDNVALLKAPYAKATGPDPVLDAGDSPQAFAGMPADFTDFKPYLDYLGRNPGTQEAFVRIVNKPDADISKEISAEVNNYERMRGLGERIKANNGSLEGVAIPAGLTSDDAGDAIDMADQGSKHQLYQDIGDLQRAWSIKRGMQIVSVLTGAKAPEISGDAAPKAPGQDPDEEMYRNNPFARQAPVSKRSRLVVHPLGSPASVKLAKRMASRSPQPGRLVATNR